MKKYTYEDKKYSSIFAIEVLEHLSNPDLLVMDLVNPTSRWYAIFNNS